MRVERVFVGLAKGLGVAVAILVLLALAGFVTLQTRWGGRQLARFVEDRASRSLQGQVEIGWLGLSGTDLFIEDLVLRESDGDLIVRVPRLVADPAVLPLFDRTLVLKEVRIQNPVLRLRMDEHLNLTRALGAVESRPEAPPPRWRIAVERLILDEGRVSYQRAPFDAGPELVLAQLSAEGSGEVNLASRRFAVDAEVTGRAQGPLDGDLSLSVKAQGEDQIRSGQASLQLGRAIDLKAWVPEPGAIVVDVDRLRIPPALGRLVAPAWPLVQPIELAGQASYRRPVVGIDLSLEVPDGADGYVMGDIVVRRDKPWRSPSGIEASLSGFSLRQVLGWGPEPPVTFHFAISPGSLGPTKLVGSLVARVPRDQIRGHQVGPAELALRIDQGQIRRLNLEAALAGATLDVRGHGSLGDVVIAGRTRVPSVARLRKAIRDVFGVPMPDVAGRLRARLRVTGAPLEGLGQVGLAFEGRVPRLRFNQVRIEDLRFDVELPAPSDQAARRFTAWARIDEPRKLALSIRGHRRRPGGEALPVVLALDRFTVGYSSARRGWVRWRLQDQARIALGRDRAAITDLTLTHGGQSIAARLVRGADGTRGRFLLSDLRLAMLPKGLLPRPAAATGVLAGRISYENQRVEGTLLARGPGLEVTTSFDVPAAWPPPRRAPLTVRADIHRLSLAKLQPAVPRLRLDGTLDGKLVVGGTTSSPRLELHVRAEPLAVSTGGQGGVLARTPVARAAGGFSGKGRLVVTYANEVLRTELTLERRAGGHLRAVGRVPIDLAPAELARGPAPTLELASRPIEGFVELERFDTRWLEALIGPIRVARGQVAGKLAVGGTLENPVLSGGVRWRQGRVVIVPRRRR